MGLVVIDLITSPVVSWRGCETPPSTAAQLSFFAQPRSWEDLSLRGGLLLLSARICLRLVDGLGTVFLDISFEYFLSFLLVYIKNLYGFAKGWEIGRIGSSYLLSIETPTPLSLGVGVMFALVACCVLCFGSVAQWELLEVFLFCVRHLLALQALFLLRLRLPPFSETSLGVSLPGTSSSSPPLGGQGKRGGSRGAPSVFRGASSPPTRLWSSERGGSASGHLSGASGLAPSSPPPSGGGGAGIALLLQTPFSRFSKSVDSPLFSPHVPRRENSKESSVSCSRVLSSRESRSSGRGSRKDKRARSREVGSRGRRRLSRSRSSSRSRSRGRVRVGRSSSASLSSRGRSHHELSRSSDRYRSRRGCSRSRCDRSRAGAVAVF